MPFCPDCTTKFCKKCSTTLPVSSFYVHRTLGRRDGLSKWCRECSSRDTRERRALNPEAHRRENLEWYYANREGRLAYSHKYDQEHREERTTKQRVWFEKNRDYCNLYQRGTRARRRGATGTCTVNDIRIQYNLQNGLCFWCMEEVSDNYHVDHLIPLSRGGSNHHTNVVIACPRCNHTKYDKMPSEWRRETYAYW